MIHSQLSVIISLEDEINIEEMYSADNCCIRKREKEEHQHVQSEITAFWTTNRKIEPLLANMKFIVLLLLFSAPLSSADIWKRLKNEFKRELRDVDKHVLRPIYKAILKHGFEVRTNTDGQVRGGPTGYPNIPIYTPHEQQESHLPPQEEVISNEKPPSVIRILQKKDNPDTSHKELISKYAIEIGIDRMIDKIVNIKKVVEYAPVLKVAAKFWGVAEAFYKGAQTTRLVELSNQFAMDGDPVTAKKYMDLAKEEAKEAFMAVPGAKEIALAYYALEDAYAEAEKTIKEKGNLF
jgi:hypothetical protein